MINSSFLISSVNAAYNKKIAENEFTAQLIEKSLEENEEYSRLKYLLRALKIDRQKAIFNEDNELSASLTEKIASVEDQLKAFQTVIKNEDNADHDCEICGDTGYHNGERCKCFFEKLNEEAYKFLELKNIAFSTFEDDELSEKQGFGRVYKTAKSFVEKMPDTDKNLLFLGQKGTGKTFLAECVATAVNDKKLNAIMISAFDLNNIFLKGFKATTQEKLITNEILTTSDLLIIDDLGAEPILNKVTVENLTAIISQRLTYKKPFIITTNLQLGEIANRYDERLFSRICGKQTVKIVMNGEDLRLK